MTNEQKFSTVINQIDNSRDRNTFINMASENMPKHNIQNLVLELLDESSFYFNQIKESNRKALVRLFLKYTDLVYFKYDESIKLDQLIKYSTQDIYHIQAINGYRVATKQEVANGVLGLDCVVTRVITEEHERFLNLLLWAITGENKYYWAAGYKIRYNESHKSIETPYTLIFQAAQGLNDLLEYMDDRYALDLDIKALKAQKKQGKYKYPEYARDQVETDMPIKTLVFTLNDILPRGSEDIEIRKALAIVLKDIGYKGKPYMKPKLSPKDISYLRGIYQRVISSGLAVKDDTSSNNLKQICDDIEQGAKDGYIAKDEFVFKIIDTLKKYKYSRVSSKQRAVLDDALRNIKVKQYSKQNTENAIKTRQVDKIESGSVFSIPDSFDDLIGNDDTEFDPLAPGFDPLNENTQNESCSDESCSNADNTPDMFDISMMLGDGTLGTI